MPLAPAAPYPVEEEAPEKEFLYTLNFGPQHPATHTTLRLILTLDGETIVKAVPDIGYLHSGFEKLGEDLDYNQYVTIVDRMNYISPICNEVAWHHAVEKLMGIELTLGANISERSLRNWLGLAITCYVSEPRHLISVESQRSLRVQHAGEDLRHLRDDGRSAVSSELYTSRRLDGRCERSLG